MSPLRTLLTLAPEHVPALVAGVLTVIVVPFLRGGPASAADKWAVALLGFASAVHLCLPAGHHHGGQLLLLGFLAGGAGFGILGWLAFHQRRWRAWSALLSAATLLGYLFFVLAKGERADLLGVITAGVELGVIVLAALRPKNSFGYPDPV